MREEPTQTDSFVLRIWRQKGQQGWRGWVQHSRTGESALVQGMAQLEAFIEGHLRDEPASVRKGLR